VGRVIFDAAIWQLAGSAALLVAAMSAFAYFHEAQAYLEAWGKPVAFYSDRPRFPFYR
jgi:hypothetical protein